MRDHTTTATLAGMTSRRRPAYLAAALAAAALAMSGCSGDSSAQEQTPTPSADPSTSEATPTEEEVFAAAEASAKKVVPMSPGARIPKDATWATEAFRKDRDEAADEVEKQGLTFKGKTTWLGARPEASDPDASGGWQVTMHVCSESTTRIYKDGKDVSAGKDGKPLPKGKREVAYLYSFATPDEGKTWQVDSRQQEEGETCGLS